MRKLMTLAPLLVALAGCDDSPRCDREDEGILTVYNCGSATLDILIDGSRYGSVGPHGQVSFTLPAGHHQVRTVFSNTTGIPACAAANPLVSACDEVALSCGNNC